jgi:hypothetical protein
LHELNLVGFLGLLLGNFLLDGLVLDFDQFLQELLAINIDIILYFADGLVMLQIDLLLLLLEV